MSDARPPPDRHAGFKQHKRWRPFHPPPPPIRHALRSVFDEVVEVEGAESGDGPRLSSLGRPELGVTFTKIHCWTLTRYRKCVFLDADTLVSPDRARRRHGNGRRRA